MSVNIEASPSINQPKRCGQMIYLRSECIEEYKRIHAAVWPEVLEQIKQSNIRDYSIYLTMTPRPTLFASFKYVGQNFDDDMAVMQNNTKVQEWWRLTDGMQESLVPGSVGSAKGPGWWNIMEEVFYTP